MTTDWRCITVRQPWAACIAGGFKPVENRSMTSNYRGWLGIHAGKQFSTRGVGDVRVRGVYYRIPPELAAFSVVVAVAQLVDVHPDARCCRPWGESDYHDAAGDKVRSVYHYVFENIRPLLPPLPADGRLGLWKPDPDLAAELDRHLPGGAEP